MDPRMINANATEGDEVLNGNVMDDVPPSTEVETVDEHIEEDQDTDEPGFEYVGLTKKFSDPHELGEYTRNLEQQLLQVQMEKAKGQIGNPKPQEEDPDEVPDDLVNEMYEKPKDFVKKLKQELRKEIQKSEIKKKTESEFWESFYAQNPDLKTKKTMVDLVVKGKWSDYANLPIEKAKQQLAKETRRLVKEATGEQGMTKTLSPKGVGGLQSSAGRTPVKTQPQEKVSDFMSEFKSFQGKKRA